MTINNKDNTWIYIFFEKEREKKRNNVLCKSKTLVAREENKSTYLILMSALGALVV